MADRDIRSHQIRLPETDPKLIDLVDRLRDHVRFEDHTVLYTWIGGTRRDSRGQAIFVRSPSSRKRGR